MSHYRAVSTAVSAASVLSCNVILSSESIMQLQARCEHMTGVNCADNAKDHFYQGCLCFCPAGAYSLFLSPCESIMGSATP